jgi:hypothetical protein
MRRSGRRGSLMFCGVRGRDVAEEVGGGEVERGLAVD